MGTLGDVSAESHSSTGKLTGASISDIYLEEQEGGKRVRTTNQPVSMAQTHHTSTSHWNRPRCKQVCIRSTHVHTACLVCFISLWQVSRWLHSVESILLCPWYTRCPSRFGSRSVSLHHLRQIWQRGLVFRVMERTLASMSITQALHITDRICPWFQINMNILFAPTYKFMMWLFQFKKKCALDTNSLHL